MIVEIRDIYIILHIDEHQIHVYLSQSKGEAPLVKMYSMQIFQYPGLVVKGLIKSRKAI